MFDLNYIISKINSAKLNHFYLVLIVGYLLFAAIIPIFLLDTPIILADEIGYLNNAASLAGLHFDGANKYSYGFSILLVPLFKYFNDPFLIYNGVQIINKIILLSSAYFLYKILYFDLCNNKMEAITAVIIAIMYPSSLIYSNLAIPENLLTFQFISLLYLLLKIQNNFKIHSIAFLIIFGALLSWTGFTHQRVYPALLVLCILFVVHEYSLLGKLTFSILIIATSSILVYLFLKYLGQIINYNYTGDLSSGYKLMNNKSSFIAKIFSWKTTKTAIGQSTYLLYASAGMLIPFLRVSYESAKSVYITKKIKSPTILFIGVLGIAIASLILSSNFMSSNIRGDMIIYGRYNEIFMPLIIAIGIIQVRAKDFVFLIYSCISLGLFAFLFSYNNLEFINTINVTSFWSHVSLQIDELALWCLATIALGRIIFYAQSLYLRAFILGSYFFLQTLLFNSNWFERFYPIYESLEIFNTIENDEKVAFDCADIYSLSDDGCKENYVGCYEWLYNKYSFLFSHQEITKLYFEEWLASDKNVFFSSNYRSEYKYLIRGSENTISGRHYVYAKKWNKIQNNCYLPDCYKWKPSDKTTISGVGKLTKNSLTSTNTPGALLYGPYILLPAGKYRYTLFGVIDVEGSPFFDITYDDASSNIYGEYIHTVDQDGIIIDTTITVIEDLSNMQTRVIVTEDETVRIDSLQLTRIK